MIKVHQIDRDAAMAPNVSRGYTQRTRDKVLRGDKDEDELVQAIAAYRIALVNSILTDPNIATALQSRMCCNGVHCGCHGATVEQYLRYQLIEPE